MANTDHDTENRWPKQCLYERSHYREMQRRIKLSSTRKIPTRKGWTFPCSLHICYYVLSNGPVWKQNLSLKYIPYLHHHARTVKWAKFHISTVILGVYYHIQIDAYALIDAHPFIIKLMAHQNSWNRWFCMKNAWIWGQILSPSCMQQLHAQCATIRMNTINLFIYVPADSQKLENY